MAQARSQSVLHQSEASGEWAPDSGRHGLDRVDPFWAPQLIVAAALALDLLLPEKLTLGPTWLLPGSEGLLLLVLLIVSPRPRMRNSPVRRYIAIGLIGLVSAANSISLVLLCRYLLHGGKSDRRALIVAGIVLCHQRSAVRPLV